MLDQKIIHNISDLKNLLANKDVILFTGNKSFDKGSFKNSLLESLPTYERVIVDFSNPTIEDLKKLSQTLPELTGKTFFAIGGGSVIDTAKLLVCCTINENNIRPIEQKNFEFYAAPTTAGTGSESTQFATFYINKVKKSVDHPSLLPDVALLDSNLTKDLPPLIKASTGVDALCQAIESYWSIHSTKQSEEYALSAIKLLFENLKESIEKNDDTSRKNVLDGANLAGKAIQITRTTAAHAISYPLTSFFNIPHGEAVSLTLPDLLSFNAGVDESDCNDQRGYEYARKKLLNIANLLGEKTCDDAASKLKAFFNSIGLRTSFEECKIGKNDLDLIIENSFNPQRIVNNPRNITKVKLREILNSI